MAKVPAGNILTFANMKYKITIKRHIIEECEMFLEDSSIMSAFDEARKLVESRNKTIKNGIFVVSKIEKEK